MRWQLHSFAFAALFIGAVLAACGGDENGALPGPVDSAAQIGNGQDDTVNPAEDPIQDPQATCQLTLVNMMEVALDFRIVDDAGLETESGVVPADGMTTFVIPIADYMIEVSAEGFETQTLPLVLHEGDTELELELEPEQPVVNPEVVEACRRLDQQIGGVWLTDWRREMQVMVAVADATCAVTTNGDGALSEGGTIYGRSLPISNSVDGWTYTIWLDGPTILFAELVQPGSGDTSPFPYHRP